MAITSLEVDLYKLDQALGGKGLVADLNDPKNKLILPAEGSDVTDEQITEMATSLEPQVIANRKTKELADKQRAATRLALLDRLGITADEAKLLSE